jgi:hypothetical protein
VRLPVSLQKGPKNTSHKLNSLKTLFYPIQPFQKVWVMTHPLRKAQAEPLACPSTDFNSEIREVSRRSAFPVD